MADAAISATINVLLGKVISPAAARILLVFGFEKELENVQESAQVVLAVLVDAKAKQAENEMVRLWLEKVERVAFEADNVFQMGSKIKGINLKLTSCNLKAMEIGLIIRTTLLPVASAFSSRSGEEFEIVAILLGFSSENVVAVLPIVGMGGLGKTTLAKSVYNNRQINSHFSKKVWICVSQKFRVTEIFKLILESLRGGGEVKMSSQDAIVQQIRTKLRGERFLSVLDDVWNEVPELWEEFFMSLVELSSTNGSCCLLTTPLQTTARIVSTHEPYFLKKLKDDDCWSILTQKATKGGNMPNEMNALRNQILSRCQGLPLVAKAIGGLLRLQEKKEWPSILENKILKFSGDHEGDNGITQILKLSFNYLPFTPIKKCFAYLSIFHKDEEMRGDELIQLWMAEGFLDEASVVRETALTMEEIGCSYLRILVQSSLLGESFDNRGPLYRMHYLVHDLAELVSKKDMVRRSSNQGRYLVLDSLEEGREKVLNNAQWVRTLFWKNEGLLALYQQTETFMLSRSKIMVLPESLCKLYNLQTLRLHYDLQGLARGMKSLISLRHLHYYNSDEKLQMPQELGRLIWLQKLLFFNVGEVKGCQIEELGYMKELKAGNLKRLEFIWGSSSDRLGTETRDKHVLEGLKPHPNLEELMIENFLGDQFPEWFGKLSALVTLKLSQCDSCTQLSALGKFPCLETLELTEMRNLTEWKEAVAVDVDAVLFPKLQSLRINDCGQLISTPTPFPSLRRLEIYGNVEAMVVRKILTSGVVSLMWLDYLTTNIINAYHLSSLKNLDIHSCTGLTNIPSETLEGCTSLDSFWVFNCPNLVSWPLDLQQTPLSSIRFDDCPKLFTQNEHMPRGFSHLCNLRDLSIGPSSNDDSIVLPDELQSFTFLKSLHLMDYGYLESLPEWLGSLVSLQTLHLKKFPKLQHLPSLHAMQCLIKLRSLEFSNCPLIKETFDPCLGSLLKRKCSQRYIGEMKDYMYSYTRVPSNNINIIDMFIIESCLNSSSTFAIFLKHEKPNLASESAASLDAIIVSQRIPGSGSSAKGVSMEAPPVACNHVSDGLLQQQFEEGPDQRTSFMIYCLIDGLIGGLIDELVVNTKKLVDATAREMDKWRRP
ncbi:OLC1v1016658C1 [Oldenlandia corymbosa var. corymbosa]|uniref:OLC1v1016658C1 n=1 Tax=Oldenlandia corymbosa var. corymbosa TaxID=529605 RepID=A0AAV1E7M4_OLDCO|nr:OLC1v1016658C1 [Oldenlandia corymbosa var. corymbosa]